VVKWAEKGGVRRVRAVTAVCAVAAALHTLARLLHHLWLCGCALSSPTCLLTTESAHHYKEQNRGEEEAEEVGVEGW